MANPAWPASLRLVTDSNASYAPLVPNVIESQVETGAPKRRRRFTAVPEKVSLTLVLSKDQMATLNTFIVTTLADVGLFDWVDFRDGSAATYYFQDRPTYTALAAGLWSAQLNLVKMP